MLDRVPGAGSNLLANIPRLESVARSVLYQSKNYDGSGFPADDVSGENIPIGSRILKVLSDLLQLESMGISKAGALEQLQKQSGCYDQEFSMRLLLASIFIWRSPPRLTSRSNVSGLAIRIDCVLSKDVKTKDGMLIITAGNRISPMLLERLRNFEKLSGIEEPVYIEA